MESKQEYTIDINDLSKPMWLSLCFGVFLYIVFFLTSTSPLENNVLHGKSPLIYILVLALAVILSAIIHEALHAVIFLFLTKCKSSSIKFGFIKGNPYCHCCSEIKVKHYKVVLLTPLFILGIPLYFLGIYKSDVLITIISIFNIVTAVGDICVYGLLKDLGRESYVQDHPSKIGFYLYK